MRSKAPLVTAVALLVLTGCAQAANGDATEQPGNAGDVDLPYATFERPRERGDGPEALLEGVLRLGDGCLSVESSGVGATYGVVLPDTSSWDAASQTVTVDGAALTIGEMVTLGGGYRTVVSLDFDHRCVRGDEVFFVYGIVR